MQTSRDHPRFSLTAFFCIYFAYFICRIKFSDFLFLYSDECLNFQSCITYIIYSSSPRYKTFRFIFLLSLSGTRKAFFKSSTAVSNYNLLEVAFKEVANLFQGRIDLRYRSCERQSVANWRTRAEGYNIFCNIGKTIHLYLNSIWSFARLSTK